MADIQITFINNSADFNNSSVVVFQKNVATNFDEIAVAWQVIKNCGRGWSNTFKYPMDFQVGAQDMYGNISDLETATNGQIWDVNLGTSGDSIQLAAGYGDPNEVWVRNQLAFGAINAQIYKSGKLLATKTGVSPQQKAVFEFKPTIWVGMVSQIEEGEVINSAILQTINTEISLLGITTANLVLSGGGNSPFLFTLIPTN